jgi:hypothetical protein
VNADADMRGAFMELHFLCLLRCALVVDEGLLSFGGDIVVVPEYAGGVGREPSRSDKS